jgi:hypothetical protein
VVGVLKLFLALGLLLAHAPVCKVDAARSLSQSHAAPASPPCCKQCKGKGSNHSAPAKPDRPTKPTCPQNCPCPLCSAPTAALTVIVPETGLDLSAGSRLPIPSLSSPPDGFHFLLDRPPRD